MDILPKMTVFQYELLHSRFPCVRLCPSLNGDLMTQFKEEKWYQGKKTKQLGLKILEETSNVAITEKKKSNKPGRSQMPTREYLPTKAISDIDFTGEPSVQCEVPAAKKEMFLDDCK